MLKKSITYTDYNDKEVTEDFYFNLSKAEIVEMELSTEGGLAEHLEKIVEAKDGKQIIAEMKNVVLGSYGIRSPDGKHFIKNDQIRQEFEGTEAYSVLFMELVTDADAAVEFTKGIIPKGMNPGQGELDLKERTAEALGTKAVDAPNLTPLPRKLTQAEIVEMDSDELKSGLATGKYIL